MLPSRSPQKFVHMGSGVVIITWCVFRRVWCVKGQKEMNWTYHLNLTICCRCRHTGGCRDLLLLTCPSSQKVMEKYEFPKVLVVKTPWYHYGKGTASLTVGQTRQIPNTITVNVAQVYINKLGLMCYLFYIKSLIPGTCTVLHIIKSNNKQIKIS